MPPSGRSTTSPAIADPQPAVPEADRQALRDQVEALRQLNDELKRKLSQGRVQREGVADVVSALSSLTRVVGQRSVREAVDIARDLTRRVARSSVKAARPLIRAVRQAGPGFAQDIELGLDSPARSQRVSGCFDLSGWVTAGSGTRVEVEVKLGDVVLGTVAPDLPRPDVMESRPWVTERNTGFHRSFTLDQGLVANGRRKLVLTARNDAGGTATLSRAVIVESRIDSDHTYGVAPAEEVLRRRFDSLSPLRVYPVAGLSPRVTLVTDSINRGLLFGGVATAMILAALLAERLGARLRIVTRYQKADELNFRRILEPNGIAWKGAVEFVYADASDDTAQIDIGPDELFLTTSWWTTWATKQAVSEDRIIYLLQEDERMFYPFGDDHLRCTEMLQSRGIRYVVNSELLYRHLVTDGLHSIQSRGIWFEPSFPERHFYREDRKPGRKKTFLFYARPNNLRNLYYRGLEAIEQATVRGILSPDEWDIHFVGKDLTPVALAGKWVPRLSENLPWTDYAALLRSVDLGLSLIYTPHPSYPPLDMAACGAVAVTNRHGLKESLDRYSRNIVCAEATTEGLVAGIAQGVALCADQETVLRNYHEQGIGRDWTVSFSEVLDELTRAEAGASSAIA
jgi:hypothetical protein